MSEGRRVRGRLLALVHALLPEDWFGHAGKRVQDTTEAISKFAEEHGVRPRDLASEGVELTRSALTGKANKDLAAAVKDFAEGERTKIETEILKRSASTEARKGEAEARLIELQVLHSEADLLVKLQKLGVALRRDDRGNLTVLPSTKQFDFEKLAHQRLLAAGEDETLESLVLEENCSLAEIQITITVADEAKKWILNETHRGRDRGFRGLRQAFQHIIVEPLSNKISQGLISTRPAFIEIFMEGDQLFFRPVDSMEVEGKLFYEEASET